MRTLAQNTLHAFGLNVPLVHPDPHGHLACTSDVYAVCGVCSWGWRMSLTCRFLCWEVWPGRGRTGPPTLQVEADLWQSSKRMEDDLFIFVACPGAGLPRCGLPPPDEGGDAVGIWKWSSAGDAVG